MQCLVSRVRHVEPCALEFVGFTVGYQGLESGEGKVQRHGFSRIFLGKGVHFVNACLLDFGLGAFFSSVSLNT